MLDARRRQGLPRIELVSMDERVVELVMAAAATARCSCTLSAPGDAWSMLAGPQGHAARIVDLAASGAASAISAALGVDADGFVLVWPADARRALRLHVHPRASLAALLDDLLAELPGTEAEAPREPLLGDSTEIRAVRERVARVAAFGDASVLIVGERGTGKALVAQSIHHHANATGDFVALDCAAIPEALFESELFGHEAGAFTGARRPRIGLLEAAAQGTVFLDGVGEMPVALQAKLLRVLETRTFRRLGSSRDVALEARIVSAANRTLDAAPAPMSHLRRDLLDRLAGFTIELPPLRSRPSDIDLLARAFLDAFTSRHGRPPMQLDETALEALRHHTWPGNVRELRALVEQMAVVARTTTIGRACVLQAFRQAPSTRSPSANSAPELRVVPATPLAPGGAGKPLRDLERELIVGAFERARGNLTRAAADVGLPRTTLRDKLRRYGLVARAAGAR